jgi:LysR family glycine cleavage system transcriptional activator
MNDLPPLNPLRAFEAAARHRSIRRAAEEMCVTPGAVSRQIKVLEEHLGIRLFRRSPSEISLTAEGERYFVAISSHFESLAEATRTLVGRKGQDVVRIRAYTTFSGKWLIPRIASFNAENPQTELRLTTSLEAVDFDRENVDAAIRLCDGHFPGLEVERLFDNELAPLCASQFAWKNNLCESADLCKVRLLHTMARPDDWRIWIEAAGLAGIVDSYVGAKFESSILAYHATLEGQGVMLAPKALFREDLERGLLIQPFGPTVSRGNFTYYLVFPRNRLRNPAMRRFRVWLSEQCAQEIECQKEERSTQFLVA